MANTDDPPPKLVRCLNCFNRFPEGTTCKCGVKNSDELCKHEEHINGMCIHCEALLDNFPKESVSIVGWL